MANNVQKKNAPAAKPALINVDHVLDSVEKAKPAWGLIRDCIDGQDKVKEKGVTYLPMPNATDKSPENTARYGAYKTRGVFVNFTARTLNGMVGTAFSKEPVATLPDSLMVMHENVDGGAVTMDQQAKQVLSDILSIGRCGLLTDYPTTNGFVSREQINKGEVRPVIQFYFAEDIINWRYATINSLRMLTLCVLREKYEVEVDEFKREYAEQWRVLRLIEVPDIINPLVRNRQCTVEVYQKTDEGIVSTGAPQTILQHDSKPFDYIPFEFVGSRNNDGGIDEAPLKAIADLNIAHYRNSCDFEEMVFILGQPTTVVSGLNEKWAKDFLGGKVIMGATAALLLPVGAEAKYLEVTESQIALKAMEHKEKQLVAIGARLVNDHTVQRTAKEAGMDDASQQSVLLAAVMNTNSAYKRSLSSACLFHGAPVSDDVGYELNADFEILQMDQAALAARVKMWTDGAISFTEVRSILRRAGIATLDDEVAKSEIEEEAAANAAAMGLGPDGAPLPGTPGAEEEEEEEGA